MLFFKILFAYVLWRLGVRCDVLTTWRPDAMRASRWENIKLLCIQATDVFVYVRMANLTIRAALCIHGH
jgi:hypothetical protein